MALARDPSCLPWGSFSPCFLSRTHCTHPDVPDKKEEMDTRALGSKSSRVYAGPVSLDSADLMLQGLCLTESMLRTLATKTAMVNENDKEVQTRNGMGRAVLSYSCPVPIPLKHDELATTSSLPVGSYQCLFDLGARTRTTDGAFRLKASPEGPGPWIENDGEEQYTVFGMRGMTYVPIPPSMTSSQSNVSTIQCHEQEEQEEKRHRNERSGALESARCGDGTKVLVEAARKNERNVSTTRQIKVSIFNPKRDKLRTHAAQASPLPSTSTDTYLPPGLTLRKKRAGTARHTFPPLLHAPRESLAYCTRYIAPRPCLPSQYNTTLQQWTVMIQASQVAVLYNGSGDTPQALWHGTRSRLLTRPGQAMHVYALHGQISER
ncbi:hypothetical protein BDP55DRAFT_637112 [Colletotrichum godetiae]|uniref:Uncharacterized protein n=1 Tax=Colletotrichum godetiae TaxID=1209918 RepID=A0AAJ0AE12_9PEZI|nr:uncharacterized protein BDP55DRAFT_637112 [Colletotrichum godetiae]KAK1659230.1 hypothetical protein BDP55DRAFT_637112 [Colletotrichum godetiae]